MEGTIGQIALFAGPFVPLNWLECNGASLSMPDNPALFTVIGTQYGPTGKDTFRIPNLPSPSGKPGTGPIYVICRDGYFPSIPM